MNTPSNQEQALLATALQLPDTEARSAYLEQACGVDHALRERIQARIVERRNSPQAAPRSPVKPVAGDPNASPAAALPADSAIPKAAVIEGPGDRIGRYRLIDQIGEGGCGVVYRAEQEEPVRRLVALKIIRLGMDTRQMVIRFEAERQALAMKDHPKNLKGRSESSNRR